MSTTFTIFDLVSDQHYFPNQLIIINDRHQKLIKHMKFSDYYEAGIGYVHDNLPEDAYITYSDCMCCCGVSSDKISDIVHVYIKKNEIKNH